MFSSSGCRSTVLCNETRCRSFSSDIFFAGLSQDRYLTRHQALTGSTVSHFSSGIFFNGLLVQP